MCFILYAAVTHDPKYYFATYYDDVIFLNAHFKENSYLCTYSNHEVKIEELKKINDKFRRYGEELQTKTDQLRGQVRSVHTHSVFVIFADIYMLDLLARSLQLSTKSIRQIESSKIKIMGNLLHTSRN